MQYGIKSEQCEILCTNNFLKDFVTSTDMIRDVLLNDYTQCLYSILSATKSSKCQCL